VIPHATSVEDMKALDFELGIIEAWSPATSLIVADFTNGAKDNNIPVGRGGASGLASRWPIALEPSPDLDPLRYQLLVERFLKPRTRYRCLTFDIDFLHDRREEVIQ